MSERSYFHRMVDKAFISNQSKEAVRKAVTASETVDYMITQILRECVNDLNKRLLAIEKQLTTEG